MILNENILIYDDIIPLEKQNTIQQYFEENYKNFIYHKKSISLGETEVSEEYLFPGWSINVDKNFNLNKEIFDIVKEIEEITIKKSNFKMLKNYRYKFNCFEPLSKEPPLVELYKNIHRDHDIEHLVLLYYVNDSDGDTLLFKNKLGNDIKSNNEVENQIKTGEISNLELIHTITPKKGRIAVFDGNMLHCAGWPTKGKRFNINYNVVIQTQNKLLI